MSFTGVMGGTRLAGQRPTDSKSCSADSKNPAEAGFFKTLKLTDKPRSFIESGVDSHSSHLVYIAKTPPRRGSLRS
ncbi:hypothetical protein EcCFBP13530_11090 [Enterobacter cancerogenus]|uniref:Uncharacterized protein n=1 Tax=Enterobacter cancerogenus TaxID=69218 RepID=A0AB38P3G2_9ENTR|nr:hypothetical protein EcCFBP13530_11090 [Enterobacter cancerogenus]